MITPLLIFFNTSNDNCTWLSIIFESFMKDNTSTLPELVMIICILLPERISFRQIPGFWENRSRLWFRVWKSLVTFTISTDFRVWKITCHIYTFDRFPNLQITCQANIFWHISGFWNYLSHIYFDRFQGLEIVLLCLQYRHIICWWPNTIFSSVFQARAAKRKPRNHIIHYHRDDDFIFTEIPSNRRF